MFWGIKVNAISIQIQTEVLVRLWGIISYSSDNAEKCHWKIIHFCKYYKIFNSQIYDNHTCLMPLDSDTKWGMNCLQLGIKTPQGIKQQHWRCNISTAKEKKKKKKKHPFLRILCNMPLCCCREAWGLQMWPEQKTETSVM